MEAAADGRKLRYGALIAQMTLDEKAGLMSGANFWNTKPVARLGIPSMMLTDGPHGLRKQGGKADHLGLHKSLPATCFPTAAALANSWDVDLLREVGACLGREAAAEDVSVLLGPGLNLKRNPLCGRNFEYFSEDPLLSGKLAAAMIRGIQSEGVAACPKHFAVNSQETHRMSVDEVVDLRALHELYLEGFRIAVQEGGAKTVMTSYNKVNGVYANENVYLLQDVLTRQWGFGGLIVTDWGGDNDRVAGLVAGNALEMPSTNGMTDREIVAAVQSGRVPEALLDERVDTLLAVLFDLRPAMGRGMRFTAEEHHEKAVDAACRSMVLLKNEGGLLPLREGAGTVCVVGDFAKTPRYQGAGSSLINPRALDNALEALFNTRLAITGYAPGFRRLGGESGRLLRQALALCAASDAVLLFLGLDEGSEAEGVDRTHMRLPQNQLALLDAIYEVNPNIVLVLAGGAPVELPFLHKVRAALHAYLPGEGGGEAVARVLTGARNPGGKLAESWPLAYEDVPSAPYYPGPERTAEHRESIYVGYRYYDTAKKDVCFPFGHGLSYTAFAYANLCVEGDEARFDVRNTGGVPGEEVAQVYARPLSGGEGVFRPAQVLAGFAKIGLAPGETAQVRIALDAHTFGYWHPGEGRWVAAGGEYEILAGASSRDIRLRQTVARPGDDVPAPYDKKSLPAYFAADVQHVPAAQFERLLGRPLPPAFWDARKKLGYADIIEQGKTAGGFGRLVYRFVRFAHNLLLRMGRPVAANNVLFAMGLPFRGVARMSGGKMDMAMLDGLLQMVNGEFWRGLFALLKAAIHKGRPEQNLANERKRR